MVTKVDLAKDMAQFGAAIAFDERARIIRIMELMAESEDQAARTCGWQMAARHMTRAGGIRAAIAAIKV